MSSRRWTATAAIALVVMSGATSYADDEAPAQPAPAASSPSPAPAVGYSAKGTWQLLALVNARRHAKGLRPLTVDPKLAATARAWTERMVARDVLAHNDALFSAASHRSMNMSRFGENVGWNFSVPAQHDAFLKSSAHRANVDMASLRVAGFAVVRGPDGRIWSTEDFGTPRS